MVEDFAPCQRFVVQKLQERRSLQIIAVVSDGLEAVQKAEELQPDLILMDVSLPKLNGIEAARHIFKLAPKTKILFLSQNLDPDVARFALSIGAGGFVVKSDAERELLTAVEAVISGMRYISRRLAGHIFDDIRDAQPPDAFHRMDITTPLQPQDMERSRGHEAQFYSDDSFFLDSFTRFIAAALEANEAVIVVATDSHRYSLFQRLQAQGVDVWAAVERGSYISLDAADTLSTFMVNDMPDPARFLKVVGDLMVAAAKRAKGEHPRIAACGECAHLLWSEGKGDAAVRLEQLWDEIAKTYDVDILCGYRLSSFDGEENTHIYQRICAEHSAVCSW